MRYGRRDDKDKIIWLVKFLESWLSVDDLKLRIDSFVEKVKNSAISEDHLQLLSKVYASINNLPIYSKLQLKSIECRTNEKISMTDDEWYACAVEEYEKKNYVESFRYLLTIESLNDEQVSFLIKYAFPDILDALIDELEPLAEKIDPNRIAWGMYIVLITSHILYFESNYDQEISFLEKFFAIHLAINAVKELTNVELTVSLFLSTVFIGLLIKAGLYNAVSKVLEESYVENEGKTIFLRDQWKPLYFAVKYLYQPEELEKQPSELSTGAATLLSLLKEGPDALREKKA
jgi:hypothetical protein